MKRSEAEDELTQFLTLHSYDLSSKEILDFIEQLGMLPPSYVGLMANGKKYNKETDFARDTMDVHGRWEPEDEA